MAEETKVEQPVDKVEAPVEAERVEEPAVETKEEVAETKEDDTKEEEKDVKEDAKEETKEETKGEAAPEETFTAEDVLKQVEFYFSDSNLPKDKFLWRTVQSNDEGWVPIKTIASFNRMKKFRPLEFIVESLKKSTFLVVSEDDELIKRKTPILPPKESDKQLRFQRSVYAKGFLEETETTQEELEKWFAQFGEINEVRLRRDENKKFKSSVFVEFKSLDNAKKFVELSPKPKYGESELLIMSKPAYVEMKAQNENFGGDKNNRKRKFNGFKARRGGKRSRN